MTSQAYAQVVPPIFGEWVTSFGGASCDQSSEIVVSRDASLTASAQQSADKHNALEASCPTPITYSISSCHEQDMVRPTMTDYVGPWIVAAPETSSYQRGLCNGSVTTPAGTSGQQWIYGRAIGCPAGYEIDASSGLTASSWQCRVREDATCPIGNPCSPTDGAKYAEEIDYPGAGFGSLRLTRYYYSVGHFVIGSVQTRKVSDHWRHNFDRRLITVTGNAELAHYAEYPDGRRRHFNPAGEEIFDRDGAAARLVAIASGGWLLTLPNADVEEYDSAGKLVAVTSRAGILTTLTYDLNQRLVSVLDAFGHELTFSYADDKLESVSLEGTELVNYLYSGEQLISAHYPDGTSKTYHYEHRLPWLLTGITDEQGQRFATYTYDNFGRVVVSEHAGSADRYEFVYGSVSGALLTTVKDPLGTSRGFRIAKHPGTPTSWKLAGIQGAPSQSFGNVLSITYLGSNPSSVTDWRNLKTCYEYDLARKLEIGRVEGLSSSSSCPDDFATYVPPAGTARRKILTQWHPTYRLPVQIDEMGRRTNFAHDADGNVLTRTILDTVSSQSRTWSYTYNSFGQVLTQDGPRTDVADVTTFTYYNCTTGNQCGQIHTITNALNHVTTYNTYNAHGQPLTMTDQNGVVTTLTYDQRQRLTSRSIGTEQTTFEYWPIGLLKKVTLPDDSFLQYTYDAAHRLTQIAGADGNRVVYTLDAMGNRTAEQHYDPSNALTQTRTRVFNTLNQLWKEIGAANSAAVTTVYGYDNNSNQTSIAAPLGRNTTQGYDELNRLTSVLDPGSGTTTYDHNALDQLTSVIDPRGLVTSYSYNALGDLQQQSSPDTGLTAHTYDSAGNLATRTDARGATVGQGVYSYDALNRITQIQYPDHTITYSYDSCLNGVGRLCGMTDASGSTIYESDLRGRVTRKSQSNPIGSVTHTRTVRYEYASGRLTALRMPEGQRINYTYDAAGRVSAMSITWPNNSTSPLLSNVLYDPAGRVRGWTWANGTFEVREYDQDGRITDIDNAGASQYGYDDADRITSITSLAGNTSPSWSYGYDLLDRLTDANRAGLAETFSYDANGNRLTQGGTQASTYSYSSPLTSNRLQSVAGAVNRTYTYDAMGNISGNGIVSFGYNGAGRMGSAGSVTYRHNGLGERTAKSLWSNDLTSYLYDEAGHLLEKCDVSTAGQCTSFFSTQYIWMGDIPVAALLPHVEYNEEGYVSVFYVGLYNAHTDHLNTPRRLTEENGAVVWQWDSDPFGVGHANISVLGPSDFDLRFPGQIFDPENWPWLHYNYYRDLDPATGRYIQSDPIGLGGGINTFAYAEGDPIALTDPFGLAVCNGRWVPAGQHVQTVPAPGWQSPPALTCVCYWRCAPCRGPMVGADTGPTSLPSTLGRTVVVHSSNRPVNTGNAGTRPTPQGGRPGGPSASMGGSYACMGCPKPGYEERCDDGKCYSDSNFVN